MRLARDRMGVKLETLASALDMTPQNLRRLENGVQQWRIEHIGAAAATLGYTKLGLLREVARDEASVHP